MMWQVEPFSEEYSAAPDVTLSCLLIPGWSFDPDIFEWLLPGLAQYFHVSTAKMMAMPEVLAKDHWIDELAWKIDSPVWLLGWSLGGNVAIELAHRYPEKVAGLCLLASTPVFLRTPDWVVGMDPEAFARFRESLDNDVGKTLHRFDLLQTSGDPDERRLRHALQQYRQQQQLLAADDLARGLDLLAAFDQRAILRELQLPMLWCFGELDTLVNPYTAYEVKALCPLAEVEIFRQCTHPLFLGQPDRVFRYWLRLLNADTLVRGKQKVAASFSRAATGYDDAAMLQRQVAGQLLSEVEKTPGYLLDAGCGTGFWCQELAGRADAVIALDMAHGMLAYGRQHFPAMEHAVESDIEKLPFADHSIGQIFSSLVVQWCEDPAIFLEEWYRVLKPGGHVYIATLGENTLAELRLSWEQVDDSRHVNSFYSIENLCEQVYQSSFALKKMRDETVVLEYDNVRAMMRDLKSIGAQTVIDGGYRGLLGRHRFARFEQAYEQYRGDNGLLPASYEVIYMVLEKHA